VFIYISSLLINRLLLLLLSIIQSIVSMIRSGKKGILFIVSVRACLAGIISNRKIEYLSFHKVLNKTNPRLSYISGTIASS
jgi:hypothetical protein